jgi:phosphoribosylanthranilate isomerase
MTIIKICGLTSVKDAVSVAGLGADIIGLVFAPSRRRISLQTATSIVKELKQLRSHPAIAGVFVNEPAVTVNRTAEYCGLDMVQLSGDESWDYCHALKLPFIKAIHVTRISTSAQVIKEVDAGYKAGYSQPFICMLDCKINDSYGGSGRSFDWDIASGACSRFPLIIAGGLSPLNVRQLIRLANPAGVDVSSGVENADSKDMHKASDFVRAVRLTGGCKAKGRQLLKTILCKGESYVTR